MTKLFAQLDVSLGVQVLPPIDARALGATLAPLMGLTRLTLHVANDSSPSGHLTCFPAAVCGLNGLEHLEVHGWCLSAALLHNVSDMQMLWWTW